MLTMSGAMLAGQVPTPGPTDGAPSASQDSSEAAAAADEGAGKELFSRSTRFWRS